MIRIGQGAPQFRIYTTIKSAHSYDETDTGGVLPLKGIDGANREGWLNPKYPVINLPYCEKIIEKFTPNNIVHKLQGATDARTMGYEYEVTLDYAGFLDGDTLRNMAHLFEHREDLPYIDGMGTSQVEAGSMYQIYFLPRIDTLNSAVGSHTSPEDSRSFRVYVDEGFEMSLIPGQGHSGFKLKLKGMDTVRTIPLG